MKKIVGIVLLIFVLSVLIGATCAAYGLECGLAAWGIAFVIGLIICIAVLLIVDG